MPVRVYLLYYLRSIIAIAPKRSLSILPSYYATTLNIVTFSYYNGNTDIRYSIIFYLFILILYSVKTTNYI